MTKPGPESLYCTVPEGHLLPDVAMPGQALRESPCEGEKRLLRAVLQSALHDYARYRDQPQSSARWYVQCVERWMSDEWVCKVNFSFCCAALGLDPGCVRQAVLKGAQT